MICLSVNRISLAVVLVWTMGGARAEAGRRVKLCVYTGLVEI